MPLHCHTLPPHPHPHPHSYICALFSHPILLPSHLPTYTTHPPCHHFIFAAHTLPRAHLCARCRTRTFCIFARRCAHFARARHRLRCLRVSGHRIKTPLSLFGRGRRQGVEWRRVAVVCFSTARRAFVALFARATARTTTARRRTTDYRRERTLRGGA